MTWNDVLDLAKRLTAVKDGIQYRGLEMGPGFTGTEALVPLMQLTVNLTDPETGEVLISQEPVVHKYMELMKAFYNIPGLYNSDPEARKDYEFTKNRRSGQSPVDRYCSAPGMAGAPGHCADSFFPPPYP